MFHRYACRSHHPQSPTDGTAQPVSVVVARLQDGTYHGATLSSFSSIALHPEPLVSFSLRLPSRLADALRPSASSETSVPPCTSPSKAAPVFSVNILSGVAGSEAIAHRFSQAQSNHEAALSDPAEWTYVRPLEDGQVEEGVPVARKGMTTLLCRTVTSLPLGDLAASVVARETGSGGGESTQEQGSMLFIARVVQVLRGDAKDVLVYKDRRYTSV